MNFGLWLVIGFISSLVVLYWVYDLRKSALDNAFGSAATIFIGTLFGFITATVAAFCVLHTLHAKYTYGQNASRFYRDRQ